MYTTQTSEDESKCGLWYESAFLLPCQTLRHNKDVDRDREGRKNIFYIKRPIETFFLTLVGVSLLLGLASSAVIVKVITTVRG
jgi:hypothetical protein